MPCGNARASSLDIFRDNLHLSAMQFHNEDEKLAALIKFVKIRPAAASSMSEPAHRAETLAACPAQRRA
jgi:hypothetical protein